MLSAYILFDTVLLGELCNKPWLKKERRPRWISPIYGRDAIEVSPVVVDIARAIEESRISTMMKMLNARKPQLGVSFIETNLTLKEMVAHWRQFIYVRTDSGSELTLRFADGAVLPVLASVLTPEQWTSITGPFNSWKIHDRDGKLIALPIGAASSTSTLPLTLSSSQLKMLKDSMAADQLLVDLRMHRQLSPNDYSSAVAHRYADQAWRMWTAAGRKEDADLIAFVGGVFDTEGRLLHAPGLSDVLAQSDSEQIRKKLVHMIEQHR
jgi:hypothetical protein